MTELLRASPVVADLIRLQRLTGPRPGKICAPRTISAGQGPQPVVSLMFYKELPHTPTTTHAIANVSIVRAAVRFSR